jgi:biopolymer transport protein ExbD
MAMSNGNTGGITPAINVTPRIDVLLVLLIIFMVIVPAIPRGESAQLPGSARGEIRMTPEAVVLEVLHGTAGEPAFRINQQSVSKEDLPARLASIYANRAQRVLFLKGNGQLSFTQIAEAIDMSHAAGVDHIGLMTPKVLAGQ